VLLVKLTFSRTVERRGTDFSLSGSGALTVGSA
jgi:hypothetical protein